MATQQWGIFTMKSELDNVIKIMNEENLEIFEVRAVTGYEKLLYCKGVDLTADLWIVMFYATAEEYKEFISKYEMTSVF